VTQDLRASQRLLVVRLGVHVASLPGFPSLCLVPLGITLAKVTVLLVDVRGCHSLTHTSQVRFKSEKLLCLHEMKKVDDQPDVKALKKFGLIVFTLYGLFWMAVFGLVSYFLTKNNNYRMIAVAIPFVITLIACINLIRSK
jgi:hypothetical protein